MGKKSKRRVGGKKPTGHPTSSTRQQAELQNESVSLEQAAAYFATLPGKEYNAAFDCTNSEMLQRVKTLIRVQSRGPPPPGWRPQTSEDHRMLADQHMDTYDMLRLTEGGDPLHELRLYSFQAYAINLIINVCGLTNKMYQEGFMAGGMSEAQAKSLPRFPNAPPEEKLFSVTEKDKKFLRSAVKAGDSPIYVAHAALALGFFYKFLDHNQDKGYRHFQQSMDVCDSTSDEQKQVQLPSLRPIPMLDGTTRVLRTVGDYLAYVREYAHAQVETGRGVQAELAEGSPSLGDSCIPGEQCDNCGITKTLLPPDQQKLLRCSRCRRTYYCSKSCQVSHWKQQPAGHKQTCRKRGEFRQGDRAKTLVKFGITPAGTIVVLAEKQQGNNWLVKSLYDKDECVLSEDHLRVLPPSEQRFHEAHDKKLFGPVKFLGGGEWEMDAP